MAYARMIVAVLVFPAESVAFVRSDTNPPAGLVTDTVHLPLPAGVAVVFCQVLPSLVEYSTVGLVTVAGAAPSCRSTVTGMVYAPAGALLLSSSFGVNRSANSGRTSPLKLLVFLDLKVQEASTVVDTGMKCWTRCCSSLYVASADGAS